MFISVFIKIEDFRKIRNFAYMDNPIDKDKITETPGLLPYAHHIGSGLIRPEDIGKVKGRAMQAMVDQTNRQLQQIYEQMQLLATQANDLKKRFEISKDIYQAQMNFEPIIGHTYYLYTNGEDQKVLSMIAPDEWGKKMPYKEFIAKVKLLSDHTWEVLK